MQISNYIDCNLNIDQNRKLSKKIGKLYIMEKVRKVNKNSILNEEHPLSVMKNEPKFLLRSTRQGRKLVLTRLKLRYVSYFRRRQYPTCIILKKR